MTILKKIITIKKVNDKIKCGGCGGKGYYYREYEEPTSNAFFYVMVGILWLISLAGLQGEGWSSKFSLISLIFLSIIITLTIVEIKEQKGVKE